MGDDAHYSRRRGPIARCSRWRWRRPGGLAEGGIPIGAALFAADGELLGRGHNRRVQDGDPSLHGETDAFRNAGRRRSYRDTMMVTTLAPCWYCSGLVRQFGIGTVVVGESRQLRRRHRLAARHGVEVVDLDSRECIELLAGFIAAHPEVWHEDIGEDYGAGRRSQRIAQPRGGAGRPPRKLSAWPANNRTSPQRTSGRHSARAPGKGARRSRSVLPGAPDPPGWDWDSGKTAELDALRRPSCASARRSTGSAAPARSATPTRARRRLALDELARAPFGRRRGVIAALRERGLLG